MTEIDLSKFTPVKEGTAEILFADNVFYNPVQEFNRDISIAVITEFAKQLLQKNSIQVHEVNKDEEKNVVKIKGNEDNENNDIVDVYPGSKCEKGISILEALSATGLRSVRMANEIAGVKQIIANDISAQAVEAIDRNIEHNNVGDIVQSHNEDACLLMLRHKRNEQFDVVDIDPYGTASVFLDTAVQAVKPGGLLCVTSTDMAVLAGNRPEKCWSLYKSMPLRIKACHEQALRILLNNIEQHANTYSRYIEPLIAISVDFYVRVFVRVHYSAAKVKDSASKQSNVIMCAGCGSFTLHPICASHQSAKNDTVYTSGLAPKIPETCEFCGHQKRLMGGPIWSAPMHNQKFVESLLTSIRNYPSRFKTAQRITGILSMIKEEVHDSPLYYITSELSKAMKIDSPQEAKIRAGICNAGYKVSSFHGKPNSIKTNAPNSVIWDVMKSWHINFGKGEKKKFKDKFVQALHEREISQTIDFTHNPEAVSKTKNITRFPELPENWGPKARAKIIDGEMKISESLEDKRKRLQGKRKNGADGGAAKISKQDENSTISEKVD